jgi:hypothetical protein
MGYILYMIEHRIKLFQDLHNNKWFHIMNHNLHVLLLRRSAVSLLQPSVTFDKEEQYILAKYGSCFYY